MRRLHHRNKCQAGLRTTTLIMVLSILMPSVAIADSRSNSPACAAASIKTLISDLYAQHMKGFFNKGPAAHQLLLNRRLLAENFEKLVNDNLLLDKCDPGNLHCIDHDLLFGTQDYWEDVTHRLNIRETNGRFEVDVEAIRPEARVGKRTLIVNCKPEPKIDDILSEAGESEVGALTQCFKRYYSRQELATCRASETKKP